MRKLTSLSRGIVIAAAVTLTAAATAAAVTFASAASATPATARQTGSPPCSLATLTGTYLFQGEGWSVSGSTTTPQAFAGSERYDGAGHVRGINSFSSGGTITRGSTFTGTYTVAANCTGTLTVGTALHFDLYIDPSGNTFTYIQTDPGSVSATTEQRAVRQASASCSLATLTGTYLFQTEGWTVSGGTATPMASAGSERYDGAGHVQGIVTTSTNGAITRGTPYTATYTVAANCTGTETVPVGGTTLHFDLYIDPSGNSFENIETDPGSVSSLPEPRVSR